MVLLPCFLFSFIWVGSLCCPSSSCYQPQTCACVAVCLTSFGSTLMLCSCIIQDCCTILSHGKEILNVVLEFRHNVDVCCTHQAVEIVHPFMKNGQAKVVRMVMVHGRRHLLTKKDYSSIFVETVFRACAVSIIPVLMPKFLYLYPPSNHHHHVKPCFHEPSESTETETEIEGGMTRHLCILWGSKDRPNQGLTHPRHC